MADFLSEILLWPFSLRVALLLTLLWLVWLLSGRLITRALSLIPYCLRLIMIAVYFLIDFPLSVLHSKLAGLFAGIDKAWTSLMSRLTTALQSWYEVWRRPKKHHSIIALLLCGLVFLWVVLPGFFGIENGIILGAENTYFKIERWVSGGAAVDYDIEISSVSTQPPLAAQPTATPSPTPEPTPIPERTVTGLQTRLIVRDKPSVSDGKPLAYLLNGDVVYDLGEVELGDTGDGDSEWWLKIETMEGVTGWVRSNYLTK